MGGRRRRRERESVRELALVAWKAREAGNKTK